MIGWHPELVRTPASQGLQAGWKCAGGQVMRSQPREAVRHLPQVGHCEPGVSIIPPTLLSSLSSAFSKSYGSSPVGPSVLASRKLFHVLLMSTLLLSTNLMLPGPPHLPECPSSPVLSAFLSLLVLPSARICWVCHRCRPSCCSGLFPGPLEAMALPEHLTAQGITPPLSPSFETSPSELLVILVCQ